MNTLNFKHPFLEKQIITYLGNKRKLISFIDETIEKIIQSDDELKLKKKNNITFFDMFAGSGVVSRYSKLKGFKTLSNDLELYSYIIQKTVIETNLEEINSIFENSLSNLLEQKLLLIEDIIENDNYQTILNFLNKLSQPQNQDNKYWSIHYSPKNTNMPDFNNERLFYTQENALKIDAIVEIIENKSLFSTKEKEIIQTSVMYAMTWNINTSGTMKGFHNGWGGTNANALERILSTIMLEKLPFVDGVKGVVYNDYAEKVFFNNNIPKVDIIYADPPYNQHQYSANYNHLTTLVKNDKYNPGNVEKGSRAGIRVDHTRSDFCKSIKNKVSNEKLATLAFKDFIQNVKAKYIVMSYNNEGVVSIKELLKLLSNNYTNTLSIQYKSYNKFRGGKSTQTSNKVVEYLIIIEMNKTQTVDDLNHILDDISLFTEQKMFLDKFINLNLCDELKENNILFHTNETINEICLYLESELILKIDKNTLKVMEENISLINKEIIEKLKKCEISNIQLMEYYIQNKNLELASKMLGKFKIKKFKIEYENFKNKILELKENNGK